MVEEDRALAQALDRMEGGKFVPSEQKATVEAFRGYVKGLRSIAGDLLSHNRTFMTSQEDYGKALSAAPAKFREASRLFREYAAEEPFAEIKKDYTHLSEDWDTLASLVERRAAEVESESKARDWGDTFRYVERTALFLDRLDAHLESFPVDLDSGDIHERHLADLKAYIEGFEALRKHLGTYREKLQSGAVSPKVREDLTTAARKPRATTIPVSYVPDASSTPRRLATQTSPPPSPVTYTCVVDLGRMKNTIFVPANLANRKFEPGETFRLDVKDEVYGTVTVRRTVLTTEAGSFIEADISAKHLPQWSVNAVLVQLPPSTPSDSLTVAARR
jgi:hypothetical protein